MAWGLTVRTFQHLFDEGWLKKGDLVADCFGGVGVTGLVAASFGCPCILVELEEKFVALAEENFSLHEEKWERMGKPRPVVVQGDSRQFASIIRETVQSVITSPPYTGAVVKDQRGHCTKGGRILGSELLVETEGYGQSEGQLGGMPEGNHSEVMDGIITSPPYSTIPAPAYTLKNTIRDEPDAPVGATYQDLGYGNSPANMGNLPEGSHEAIVNAICTSPPFQKSEGMQDKKWFREHREEFGGGGVMGEYAPSEGNVGGLTEGSLEKVIDAVITSPPYEEGGGHGGCTDRDILQSKNIYMPADEYGNTEGNIGNQRSSTYWGACSQVYLECLKVLRPGGIMCVVVKDFIRQKKRVPLCDQTLELLEAIGFEPLERIRAWMTAPATQKSLMPEVRGDYVKSWKSFFRRLAERKGSPPIDFEQVLIVRKPI